MRKTLKYAFAAAILAFLTACGGGGGGGESNGPVASTNTFNIQSGYQRLVSTGYSKTFNITGTCTGKLTITAAPATTATTFEGTSALSGAEVGNFSWTGCTPASGATTTVRYFDSNYVPRGFSQTGNYGVYLTAPFLPSIARVNDVVVIGTITKYTSSAKTTPNGRTDMTLSMEADTATTAIANIIAKAYNASGTLTSTEQDRYRVAADGSLTPLSVDIQYSNGSTTHLVGN
jgi:hypothetical protein